MEQIVKLLFGSIHDSLICFFNPSYCEEAFEAVEVVLEVVHLVVLDRLVE